MKTITAEWLKSKGASDYQVSLFVDMFGASADLTRDNLARAAECGLSLDWLAEMILTVMARQEYMAAIDTAREEYVRMTAPAWQEYERVIATATQEYERVKATALADALGLPVDGMDRDTVPGA